MTNEFISLLKIFLKSLSQKDCSSKYSDLFNELIGKTKEELKDNNSINCIKAGKSQQKVYVCSEYVYKAQPLNVSRRINASDNDNDIKVDSFTMNIIMQNMMKSIVENFIEIEPENVENPLDLCTKDNHLIMIYNKSNLDDFQKFLTDRHQDYETDDEYKDEIIKILLKIFEVNDKLYDICQFQHCDMKCMQILLDEDSDGNITPKLSDFDKSTCSLFFDGEAYRIRLVKLDTPMMGDIHDNSGIEFMGSKTYRKTRRSKKLRKRRKTRKHKKTRKSRKTRKTRKTRKSRKHKSRKGGSIKKYLKRSAKKLSAKLFHKTPKRLKRMAYGDQGLQRFKEMPLKNNNYYNACLLSSTLLQAKINPSKIIDSLKQTKYSIITEYIDQAKIDKIINRNTGRIMGNLREINDTNLSGNVIAAQCVKYPNMFEKSNKLESHVEVIKNGSNISFVKKTNTKKMDTIMNTKMNTKMETLFKPEDHGYILMNTDTN